MILLILYSKTCVIGFLRVGTLCDSLVSIAYGYQKIKKNISFVNNKFLSVLNVKINYYRNYCEYE